MLLNGEWIGYDNWDIYIILYLQRLKFSLTSLPLPLGGQQRTLQLQKNLSRCVRCKQTENLSPVLCTWCRTMFFFMENTPKFVHFLQVEVHVVVKQSQCVFVSCSFYETMPAVSSVKITHYQRHLHMKKKFIKSLIFSEPLHAFRYNSV